MKHKAKRHILAKVAIALIFISFVLELLLWFYANPLLNKAVHKVVVRATDSLYDVSFSKIRVNVFTRSMYLTDFVLKPDTAVKTDKNLYRIEFDRFDLERFGVLSYLQKKQIYFGRIAFTRPKIYFYSVTKHEIDTTVPVGYSVVKQDFLSVIFKYVNSLYVSKIQIINGEFGFLKDLKNTFNAKEVTLTLRKFYVDRNTIDQKDLFTRDFEIIIKDYSINLGNDHRVVAQSLVVDSKQKTIVFNSTRLYPVAFSDTSNSFDVFADKVTLEGADFQNIYLNRDVDLDLVKVNGLGIKFYNFKPKDKHKKTQANLKTPYEIYLLIKGYLNYIHVKDLEIANANFEQFSGDRNYPDSRIGHLDFKLYDLYIDSAAAFDTSRFFFARNVFLDIHDYSAKLKDSLHAVVAKQLLIDTRAKTLQAHGFRLFPYRKVTLDTNFAKSLNNITAQDLVVNGFDLMKFYHTRDLHLNNVSLDNSDINILSYQLPAKKHKKAGILQLLSGILNTAAVDNFSIRDASYSYKRFVNGTEISTSGKLFFGLEGFNINVDDNNIKDALDFSYADVLFTDLKYFNSNSIHLIEIDTLNLQTKKNLFKIKNFKLKPTRLSDSLLVAEKKSVKFDFLLPELRITGFDLKEYLTEDKMIFSYIGVLDPQMNIISYPELSLKDIKSELRDKIRQKAASQVVLTASNAIFDIYQRIPQIDSVTYKLLKYKLNAIDSLQNFAVSLIFDIHIPNSQINVVDTSAKVIDKITTVFNNGLRALEDSAITMEGVDSVWSSTLADLLHIKMLSQKPMLNFEEISKSIANLVREVRADSILLTNANLRFTQNYEDKSIEMFNNQMNLWLYGFDFRADSLSMCKRNLLCSKSLKFAINNYNYYFPDSVHRAHIESMVFRTADSSLTLKNVIILADSAKYKTNVLFAATLPLISFEKVDYWKVLDSNKLDISGLTVKRGFIHVYVREKSRKKTEKKPGTLVLPAALSKIFINTVSAADIALRYDNSVKNQHLNTQLGFRINKVGIDSTINFKGYASLPLDSWAVWSEDLSYKQPGMKTGLDYAILQSNGDLSASKIYFRNNSLDFSLDTLALNRFNIDTFVTHRAVVYHKLFFGNPAIGLLSSGKKKDTTSSGKSFDLAGIDVYAMMSKFLTYLKADSTVVANLSFNNPDFAADSLYLIISGMRVDSTTKIDSPNLFYADNVYFEWLNFHRKLSDLYSLSVRRMGLDLKSGRVFVDTLKYYSNYPPEEFMKKQEYRTTLTDVDLNHLSVNNIKWDSLLFAQKLFANSIFIDGLWLYAYVDRSLPPKPGIKPHYTEMLLKASLPIDIKTLLLRNGEIIYEEKAPDGIKPGRIELNDLNAVLSNITNQVSPENPYLNLRLSGLIENHGYLTVYGFFKLDTNGYPFKFYGLLGRMDLKDFNDYLVYSANLEITSGMLNRAEFVINGQDSIATGYLKANYRNLGVNVLKSSPEFSPRPRKFLSWLADVVVRKDNPKYGIFYKTGTIAYIHDRRFSDLKFWIKAIVSGIKSAVLFENKREQRKILRLKRKYSMQAAGQKVLSTTKDLGKKQKTQSHPSGKGEPQK